VAAAAVCAAAPCAEQPPECRGDFDGDQRVSVDELVTAVRNSLQGCPDSEPGDISLSLRVERPANDAGVRIVAHLLNGRDSAVAYRWGCTTLCRPAFHDAIYFTVIGPNGAEVLVDRPCFGPLFCGERTLQLGAGEQLEQGLTISGIRWDQEDATPSYCGTCTERDLDPGRYLVVARFLYSENPDQPSFPEQIAALAEFTWP